MDKEQTDGAHLKTKWFIAVEWFQQNNRSLAAMVLGYLCPACASQRDEKVTLPSADALLATIRDCCSQAPDFIHERMPISESVFRLFLRNGNKPLQLQEMGTQLNELRGGDPYRTTPETLLRILKSDCYYGFREA